jgi:diguanylate cyclase (GGDEF)-like protein
VSDATKNYYHYDGFFKKVTTIDQHDRWYYTYKESHKTYMLDVDQDEVDNQKLTIFINCEILDEKGDFLGVTGVGVEMDYVQDMLSSFESTYDLEAFLVDNDGLVQAHTNNKLIETRNINHEQIYEELGIYLYDKSRDLNVFHIEDRADEQYVISHYIEELDWFLIVRKDTSVLSQSFNRQLIINAIITIIVLLIVMGAVSHIVSQYQKQVQNMALKDPLTDLANRRCFDLMLSEHIRQHKMDECLYIIDIDSFKKVNDTHGHLQGDQVLLHVTEVCKNFLDETLLSRWGGDEFAGILHMPLEESNEILLSLCRMIEEEPILMSFGITLSIGVTKLLPTDTADSVVKRADLALYLSKTEGKNRVTII